MDLLIKATLRELEAEMDRLYFNKNQKEMISPFQNTGAEYSNDTFSVRAYNWDDENDCSPNFKYKDLQIWWYKHAHRGVEWLYKNERNSIVPSEFLNQMLKDCIESISEDWDIK